ncbi:hypothetical protein FA95DRAFT_1505764, partial [Auriscalpium vulgare]
MRSPILSASHAWPVKCTPIPSLRRRACPTLSHLDVHGPLPVRTPSGYRYWVTFIDD